MTAQTVLDKVKLHGLDSLEEFSIRINRHEDGRVILNYNMLESPKTDPITIGCRSLTISERGELIARGFDRFFNCNEALDITNKFDWENPITAYDKIDGSFIKIFYWNGWKIQTRNSFGDAEVQVVENGVYKGCGYSWSDLVKQGLSDSFFSDASTNYTFIFELTSPYNKVVQTHNEVSVWLLTIFNGLDELSDDEIDTIGRELGLKRPARHTFYSMAEVKNYISKEASHDKTFEGVVLKDVNGLRLKVKSEAYVALHRLFDNGNVILDKNIVPLILDGEIEEVLSYFPHIKERVTSLKSKIEEYKREVDDHWYVYSDEKSRKKFAQAVKDCRWNSLLFLAYERGGHPFNYLTSDFVVKFL